MDISVLYTALEKDIGLDTRDSCYISNRFSLEGVSFVAKVLPKFYKELLASLEHNVPFHPASYALSGKTGRPYFLKKFTDVIFDDEASHEAKAFGLFAVSTVCGLFYKTKAAYNETQCQKVTLDFIEDDASCRDFTIAAERPGVRSLLSYIIRSLYIERQEKSWFSECKDGPGVCAEGGIERKLERVLPLPSTAYQHELFFNQAHAEERLLDDVPYSSLDYFRPGMRFPSKGIFVPKDSRGPRFIAAEPSQNMRLQQSVMYHLVHDIESRSKNRINFKDQSINANIALAASRSKSFQTLDLKAASDRVPLDVVNLFDFRLRDILLQTRSYYMDLPGHGPWKLSKFAPMGSALCFPVLSLLTYATTVAYMVVEEGWDFEEAKLCVFVFGDDLIVPNDVSKTGLAAFLLETSNLKVNVDKSYTNSHYRESCGEEGFHGFSVKTVKVRHWPDHTDEGLLKTVELGNNAYSIGLRYFASECWSFVERKLGRLPYGCGETPYLCKVNPDIPHEESNVCTLPVRWRGKRPYIRVYKVKSKEKRVKESVYDFLFRTRCSNRDQVHVLGSKVQPKTMYLTRKWERLFDGYTPSDWLPPY